VHGALLSGRGERDAAEKAFRKACALARAQGAKLWELRASRDLAELLSARGAPAEARAALESAVAAFDDRVDAPDLRRARTLLHTLTQANGA